MNPSRDLLVVLLGSIQTYDPSDPGNPLPEGMTTEQAYSERNRLIYQALAAAESCGYPNGIQPDPAEEGWVIAYIELPSGQVSWHLPGYVGQWDGHSTAEKYHRVREFEQGAGQ